MSEEEQKINKWSGYSLRILLNAAAHPFEYAKVLIQLGYEPIPPRPTKTLFGKPALALPNIFQYVKHIKSVDGLAGCYRGLGIKLCGHMVSVVGTQQVMEYLELGEKEEEEEDTEEARKRNFLKHLKGDIITHSVAIVVSHPFHVITIRVMAQFVGKENNYTGIFASVVETYRQSGILGFFSGLIPRLLGDILTIILASGVSYALNKYFIQDKQLQSYVPATMTFVASSIMYPFQVVSSCMAITNCGLIAGSPPYMPHYTSWMDCWSELSSRNQLKRGSSLLSRYYTGSTSVGTRLFPPTSSKDSRYMF